MAQASGYEHDIFISYAHDDNQGLANRPGWVDIFVDGLDGWLRKRRGMARLKIWQDRTRMHGNTLFDDAIQKALHTSALFFALTSSNYLSSDYCRKELQWFHRHHGRRPGGLRVGEAFRIFNILLRNVAHTDWPEELQGAAGFPLHDARSAEQLGDFTSPDDPAFEKQMRAVVDAVEAVLRQEASTPNRVVEENASDRHVSVFIADVADTLQEFKERVITEARSRDADVVTDIPPPMEAAGHAEAVGRELDRADVSVHLLDQWPGRRVFDRRETTYLREQHETAFQKKIPQLVWVHPDLDLETVADDQQRQFLRNCENRPRELAQYEFVRCLPTDFINIVLERISRCRQPAPSQSTLLNYLVDTHQKDQRFAFRLADFLLGSGAEVDFNHESQDPATSLTKFEQSVRRVRNLILICGKVGPAWVLGRVRKAFKAISEQFESGERSPLETIWVFLAPSSGGRPDFSAFPPLIHITILDNSHSESIDPHITAKLLDSGAGR